MRIAYCTNVRLPSERAHGHQIAQVCDALDILGHDVTVYAPYRRNPVTEEYHAYYGARPGVSIRHLGSFDPINRAWLPGVLGLWTLNALLRTGYGKAIKKDTFDLLYTRAAALLPVLLATGIPVVLELHSLPRIGRARFVRLASRCRLAVCLTSAMRDELVAWGMPAGKVIVEGDAYDPTLFEGVPGKKEAREHLNIPAGMPVIGYAGQLVSMGLSKGIPELLGALELLHTRGIIFRAVIAGAPDAARVSFESSLPPELRSSVRFAGVINHADVPTLLSACDILVYPAPKSDHPYYNRDTSPLKLFEYMAAGRAIVCADLPPLRDVIDDQVVRFCHPGDPASLADALETVIKDPHLASRLSQRALEVSRSHTWIERMHRILEAATLRS